MNIKYIKCKTALSDSKLPGLDYSLNPYVGCQHNCSYCYAPNVLKIDRNKWGNNIGIKLNIPIILSKEIKKKRIGTIGISTVTDPYQPIEKKYKLTRYCLEQLKKYDFPIHIQTKSSIVNRDFDIISKISKVDIMISISSLNDDERKIFEPFSSSIKDRLEILSIFSEIGIRTSVFLGPIFPTIKDEIPIVPILFFLISLD
ncbi:radical SAM protein, partial [Thermoplasmatota archaeon]